MRVEVNGSRDGFIECGRTGSRIRVVLMTVKRRFVCTECGWGYIKAEFQDGRWRRVESLLFR